MAKQLHPVLLTFYIVTDHTEMKARWGKHVIRKKWKSEWKAEAPWGPS